MNIAFAIRDFYPEWDAASRHVMNAGAELASEGHRIYLVTESSNPSPAGAVNVIKTHPSRSNWEYFTEAQQYADRAYDTLAWLEDRVGLDIIEFTDRGGEGLTTIRGKRLLNEFSRTGIVVRLHGSKAFVAERLGERPTDFRSSILSFAEDYCVRHANVLMAPSAALSKYAEERGRRVLNSPLPLSREYLGSVVPLRERVSNHILFSGTLDPAGGVD